MLDQLDRGDGVEWRQLGEILERTCVEGTTGAGIDLIRILDLRSGDVDSDTLMLFVQRAEQRARSAADIENAGVALQLRGHPFELEVMPLALDAAAAVIDAVVMARGNARVVERSCLRNRRPPDLDRRRALFLHVPQATA